MRNLATYLKKFWLIFEWTFFTTNRDYGDLGPKKLKLWNYNFLKSFKELRSNS